MAWFNARWKSTCPCCGRLIVPGDRCGIDPESRMASHDSCLALQKLNEDPERAVKILELREKVQQVSCRKCRAPANQSCRELGVPGRLNNHRERVADAKRLGLV